MTSGQHQHTRRSVLLLLSLVLLISGLVFLAIAYFNGPAGSNLFSPQVLPGNVLGLSPLSPASGPTILEQNGWYQVIEGTPVSGPTLLLAATNSKQTVGYQLAPTGSAPTEVWNLAASLNQAKLFLPKAIVGIKDQQVNVRFVTEAEEVILASPKLANQIVDYWLDFARQEIYLLTQVYETQQLQLVNPRQQLIPLVNQLDYPLVQITKVDNGVLYGIDSRDVCWQIILANNLQSVYPCKQLQLSDISMLGSNYIGTSTTQLAGQIHADDAEGNPQVLINLGVGILARQPFRQGPAIIYQRYEQESNSEGSWVAIASGIYRYDNSTHQSLLNLDRGSRVAAAALRGSRWYVVIRDRSGSDELYAFDLSLPLPLPTFIPITACASDACQVFIQ